MSDLPLHLDLALVEAYDRLRKEFEKHLIDTTKEIEKNHLILDAAGLRRHTFEDWVIQKIYHAGSKSKHDPGTRGQTWTLSSANASSSSRLGMTAV